MPKAWRPLGKSRTCCRRGGSTRAANLCKRGNGVSGLGRFSALGIWRHNWKEARQSFIQLASWDARSASATLPESHAVDAERARCDWPRLGATRRWRNIVM